MKWLSEHPEILAAIVWPALTAIVTALFKPRTPEQYDQIAAVSPRLAAALRLVGALGFDAPKALEAAKAVVSGESKKAPELRVIDGGRGE